MCTYSVEVCCSVSGKHFKTHIASNGDTFVDSVHFFMSLGFCYFLRAYIQHRSKIDNFCQFWQFFFPKNHWICYIKFSKFCIKEKVGKADEILFMTPSFWDGEGDLLFETQQEEFLFPLYWVTWTQPPLSAHALRFAYVLCGPNWPYIFFPQRQSSVIGEWLLVFSSKKRAN
jgi:hypothetical protein